jgi:hypothetical protein
MGRNFALLRVLLDHTCGTRAHPMTHGSPHQENGATRLMHALSVLSIFGVGILGAGWLAQWLGMGRPYLFVLAAYVAVVLAHELGHAVAGLLSDFRVAFLYLGPVRVEWPSGGRVKVDLNRRLGLWGGAVVVLPRSHPREDELGTFRRRMIAMFAAGPGASIVAGAAALVVSLLFPPSHASGLSWLLLLGLMSVLVGLGQVIPIRIGNQRSDGSRVLRLLRRGPGTYQALFDAMVVANADGVRPREWPLPPPHTMDTLRDLPTLVMIYYALMDRGRHGEAWKVLDGLGDRPRRRSERTWQLVRDLERTYMCTVYRSDGVPDLPAADIPPKHQHISTLSLVRARTARLVAEGNAQGAVECADSVRRLRSMRMTSGLTQFNLSEIDKVLGSVGRDGRG